jgi:O-antigen ligase
MHINRSRPAELALAFGGLLWLTHGVDFVLYDVFPKSVVRAFALALYATSAAILFANRRGQGAALMRTWPVWIAPVLATISMLWSDAPDLTLRRSSALLGSTCFGVFLATRLRIKEQINLVAACAVVLAAISLVLVAFFPDVGLMVGRKAGMWQGVFSHKNYLGRAMALGALALLLIAFRSGASRWAAAGLVLCIPIVFASRSASGLIVLAVTLAVAATLRIIQTLPAEKRRTALIAFGVAALIGTGLVILFADEVLSIVGRDATLTGRVRIWRASLEQIVLQPWCGYGYGAVWYTERPGVDQIIARNLGFDPFTAHSGFFDLLLELGVAGVLSLAVPFALCAVRAVSWITTHDSPTRLWPAAYLVFFVVANIAESELLRQNSIFYVLFVATVIATRAHDTSKPNLAPELALIRQKDLTAEARRR